MLFESFQEVECTNELKVIQHGFMQCFKRQNMKQVQSVIRQEDAKELSESCCICLISAIVAVSAIGAAKRVKLDSGERTRFPRYLSDICRSCLNENDDELKTNLRDIILFWFEGYSVSVWKVLSNFRKIIPWEGKGKLLTYEWKLFQSTNSLLTIVTIPIVTQQVPTLLLNGSYAFLYNEKEKILSASVHQNFRVGWNSMVDNREEIQKKFLILKKEGESRDNDKPEDKISLVNSEKFVLLYLDLKEKYFSFLANIWSGMHPFKCILHGLIASAYLLLLWEEEREHKKRESKQSFVHLKCGNGSLVYILTNEGHPGKGIDVERHTMWDSYNESIALEESPIYPHQLKVEADWIIGFKSEEISPWIPIIAARSSCTTNFFVLPSRFYDLDGTTGRFEQRGKRNDEYFGYLSNIAENFGFKVERDKIPVKVQCFVGHGRIATVQEDSNYDESIDKILKSLLEKNSCSVDIGEQVCSGIYSYKLIKQDLIEYKIANNYVKERTREAVINVLLSEENFSSTGDDKVTSSGHKWSEWNAGATLAVTELEKLISPEVLKSWSRGIMGSFLNAYRDIMTVTDGKVSLNDYRNEDELQKAKVYFGKINKTNFHLKTYMCWFYKYHPQGCVLSAKQCYHAHGVDDANLFNLFY